MVQRKNNPRTQINEVQRRFESDLYHRLVRDDRDRPQHEPLAEWIRERIADDDALGLDSDDASDLDGLDIFAPDGGTREITADFDFAEDPARAADFEEWLAEKIEEDVLVATDRGDVIDGGHWSAEYIRDSSKQGIKHADRELRRVGIDPDGEAVNQVLRTPVQRDIVAAAYRRTYDELEGVTEQMGREIARSMSDGLSQGKNPVDIARDMTERTDVGLSRSRRIARTETARTYNTSTAARYDDHGVTQVRVLTSNPCEACASLAAGGPYPVEDAADLLPEHSNCVCSISPVTDTIE